MDGIYVAFVTVGFGALWWRKLRSARAHVAAWNALFDPDAEIALHVARHVASSRGQPGTPLHLLYGLLQDETIAAAVRHVGGDVAAVEARVLTALDERARRGAPIGTQGEAQRALENAAGAAHYGGRKVTCTGLWGNLRSPTAEALLEEAGVKWVEVLYRLVHGAEPDLDAATGGEACVIFYNDDFTTMEFVSDVSQAAFALPKADAEALMQRVHREGRASLGRYPAAEARAKALDVRRRARAQGYPLRVAVEAPEAAPAG